MATITNKQAVRNTIGQTPWGNATTLRYTLKTTATGAVEGGSSTAAVASGDVVQIGVIPAGLRLIDSQVIIKTGMTASVTGDLGFRYVDQPDSASVPQDAQYFGAALALTTAARLRNATTKVSVALPKEAFLTLTTGGAANAKASEIEIVILAVAEGVK